MEVDCDRCEEGTRPVGMWEDSILSGRIDAICEDCYKAGERIHRPIEPPIDDDGNLQPSKKYVDCPNCEYNHIADLTNAIDTCWVMMLKTDDTEKIVFNVYDAQEVTPNPYAV